MNKLRVGLIGCGAFGESSFIDLRCTSQGFYCVPEYHLCSQWTNRFNYRKWEFKRLIDERAVDVLQPDANRTGGITEMIKICALDEAADLPAIPHSMKVGQTKWPIA
jgi:hypothetical protein